MKATPAVEHIWKPIALLLLNVALILVVHLLYAYGNAPGFDNGYVLLLVVTGLLAVAAGLVVSLRRTAALWPRIGASAALAVWLVFAIARTF